TTLFRSDQVSESVCSLGKRVVDRGSVGSVEKSVFKFVHHADDFARLLRWGKGESQSLADGVAAEVLVGQRTIHDDHFRRDVGIAIVEDSSLQHPRLKCGQVAITNSADVGLGLHCAGWRGITLRTKANGVASIAGEREHAHNGNSLHSGNRV